MKYCFIINSRISQKKKSIFLNTLSTHFNTDDYKLFYTDYAGHAITLARDAITDKENILVAVGGDGTVNEVLQVAAANKTKMAIIPCGSGNGMARHCNIPIDIPAAMACLKSNHFFSIDIAKINEIYFASNVGFGFDATLCHYIKNTNRRGLWMYIRYALVLFYSYKKQYYEIEYDNKILNTEAFMLNVANGKEFGYGFCIAPTASLIDGVLDIMIVKKMNLFYAIQFLWDAWNKKLHRNKNCIHLKAKTIRIYSNKLQQIQTDGDAHNTNNNCNIAILHSQLPLCVPHNAVKDL